MLGNFRPARPAEELAAAKDTTSRRNEMQGNPSDPIQLVRRPIMPGMTRSLVIRIVEFCTRYPWPILVGAAVITVAAGFYAVDRFAITTNVKQPALQQASVARTQNPVRKRLF